LLLVTVGVTMGAFGVGTAVEVVGAPLKAQMPADDPEEMRVM
jgi:hypothetical protein